MLRAGEKAQRVKAIASKSDSLCLRFYPETQKAGGTLPQVVL